MKTITAIIAAAALCIALAACDAQSDASETKPAGSAAAPTAAPASSVPGDPKSCKRNEAGQTECLIAAFGLTQCADAAVLGSMYRDNARDGTHQHRTAYGVDAACLDNIREAAITRGLRKNGKGEFVGELEPGYREAIIIGLQVSADGTVIEWERTKE